MKKFFRKALAIALIAAAVGTTGIMPAMTANAASTAQISAEVANSIYSVAFKEPYTNSKVFKDLSADGKFQSVTISAVETFRIAVYNSDTFKTTDKITIYRSKKENGPYTAARNVTPTESGVSFISLKQTPGTTMFYSVEVTNAKGVVQYAQRFKVTMAKEEIGNNKYTYELRTSSKAGDSNSYVTKKLNVSKADNKQPVINLIDTQRFYFDIKDVPDGYSLEVEADLISFRNSNKPTQTFSRVRASKGSISFNDYIYKDEAKSMKFTLRDISGNAVMCARYKFIGVENPVTMKTNLIYSYDGGSEQYTYLTTSETSVDGNTSLLTKDLTTVYNAKLHSVYVPLKIVKEGGLYDDSEVVKVYMKANSEKSYGDPIQTIKHATTENQYRTFVKLPKVNTPYDIKVELLTSTGKTLAQEYTNVSATTTSSTGISEYYATPNDQGKLTIKTTNFFFNSGDTINDDAFEIPVYTNSKTKYNEYSITVGSIGDPAAVYRIYVRQNGTERLAFEQSNMTSSTSLGLKVLGINPKVGTSADIIVRSYNANGAKLSQWSRTIKFVEPQMFNYSIRLLNNSDAIYKVDKELYTNTVTPSDTQNISNLITYNLTNLTIEAKFNDSYKGLPGNVTGTIYIRKAGEKTSTKLFSVSEYLEKELSGKSLPTVCSLGGYSLKPGETYTLSIRFYNKNTKKNFYTNAVTFKYISSIG